MVYTRNIGVFGSVGVFFVDIDRQKKAKPAHLCLWFNVHPSMLPFQNGTNWHSIWNVLCPYHCSESPWLLQLIEKKLRQNFVLSELSSFLPLIFTSVTYFLHAPFTALSILFLSWPTSLPPPPHPPPSSPFVLAIWLLGWVEHHNNNNNVGNPASSFWAHLSWFLAHNSHFFFLSLSTSHVNKI